MKIRDFKGLLVCLVLFGIGCIFASCSEKENISPEPQNNTPIEVSADTEWKPLAKATMVDNDVLYRGGFVVWGHWKKISGDNLNYTGDYSSGATHKVFGEKGTKVTHTSPAAPESGKWDYNPKRFWSRGIYLFAAAAPSDMFQSSYPSKSTGALGTIGENSFTLDFGTGINVETEQKELVVGLATKNNQNDDVTGAVNFTLSHQFPQLNLQAFTKDAYNNYKITSIELSGYHTIGKTLVLTSSTSTTWTYGTMPDISYTSTGEWNIINGTETNPVSIISGRLVIPQSNTVKVKVTFTETPTSVNGNLKQPITRTAQGSISAVWQPDNIYTYKFELTPNGIRFGEPSVTPWGTVESIGGSQM